MRASIATFQQGTSLKISYLCLACGDLVLTAYAFAAGFTELNPLIARLETRPLELVVVKGVVPALIAWLVPAKLLLPSIALLAAIVAWNIGQLLLAYV
jgi:hypothetical protein